MQLNKVQEKFAGTMFTPIGVPQDDFAAIFHQDEIALDERLKIYKSHIVTSLSGVLVDTFPFIKALAGEDFLRMAAKHYLIVNPPREACLDLYGAGFADFLDTFEPAQNHPYFSDAARLDWAMQEARCAKDDTTLSPENLSAINPDTYMESVFTLKSSVRVLRSPYPLDRIYAFCNKDGRNEEEQLDITGPETFLLVLRIGWEPQFSPLEKSEFVLFEQLAQQKPLGKCLSRVLEQHPDFDFATFFKKHIALETFSGFYTNNKKDEE